MPVKTTTEPRSIWKSLAYVWADHETSTTSQSRDNEERRLGPDSGAAASEEGGREWVGWWERSTRQSLNASQAAKTNPTTPPTVWIRYTVL